MLAWQGLHVLLVTVMGGYVFARRWAGLLGASRRAAFDCTWLMLYYTAAQGAVIGAVIGVSQAA
jgi:cytochrome c oxidase subunit I+III